MIIKESVVIKSSLEHVWDTFTDLTCWQDWSTVVTKVSSDNDRIIEGGRFKFCIRPFDIPVHLEPVVDEVVPFKRIVWSGKKHGITARHEFTFRVKDGVVQLKSKETFSGIMVKSLKPFFPKNKIQELSRLMLIEVKKAAETKDTYRINGQGNLWEKKLKSG
jgi:hypothetical protein